MRIARGEPTSTTSFWARVIGGVEQVALQHHVVGGQQRDDHGRKLAALRLVHADRVGVHQLVHLQKIVGHRAIIHLDGNRLVLQVHRKDPPHVAVEDLFVIVVADLHHPVAGAVGPAAHLPLGKAGLRRVERLLQPGVKHRHTDLGAVHRAEHLDLVRPQPELARDALGDDLHHQVGRLRRVFLAKEKKIGRAAVVQQRHLPAVDAVGIGDDVAALRLPEDGVETDDGGG